MRSGALKSSLCAGGARSSRSQTAAQRGIFWVVYSMSGRDPAPAFPSECPYNSHSAILNPPPEIVTWVHVLLRAGGGFRVYSLKKDSGVGCGLNGSSAMIGDV